MIGALAAVCFLVSGTRESITFTLHVGRANRSPAINNLLPTCNGQRYQSDIIRIDEYLCCLRCCDYLALSVHCTKERSRSRKESKNKAYLVAVSPVTAVE